MFRNITLDFAKTAFMLNFEEKHHENIFLFEQLEKKLLFVIKRV